MTTEPENVKIVARNRKAWHDFVIEDTCEAGMVLQGTEVKSLRDGACSLDEAYARPQGQELYLFDMHIPPYEQGNIRNHEPKRPRKLLLHRREIARLFEQVRQRGYTLIPTRIYLSGGRAKVEVALARGKKQYDKRREIADREAERDLRRALSHKGKA